MKSVSSSMFITSLLIILSVWACAPGKQPNARDRQLQDRLVLEKRVREYMSYRIQGQLDKLYEMLTPEFRKKTTLQQFVSNPVEVVRNFSAYTLDSVVFEDSEHATVRYTEQSTGGTFGLFFIRPGTPAKWEKVDGVWYHSEFVLAPIKPVICGDQQTWPPVDFEGTNTAPAPGGDAGSPPSADHCGQ